MVPSHRELGSAEVAALFPEDWIFETFLLARLSGIKDKVTAGLNPADPAKPVR
jgi:hypothetical protein